MRSFEVLILLASVTGIKSGYDNNYGQAESALNNIPFFIHPAALAQMIHRLSSGGVGGGGGIGGDGAIEVQQQGPSNTDGMTTYVTTGSKMHDSKDFPSQPQLYSSGNFVPSEHLNGIHQQQQIQHQHQLHHQQQQQHQQQQHEASLKSSRNSPISHHHSSGPIAGAAAAAAFHPNQNGYSVQIQTSNDEHFVPSYGHHSEHENNAVSLADEYTSMNVANHHHHHPHHPQAHVHDNNQQIQQFLYENRIENHHTNQDGHSVLVGNELDKYHEASTNNIVIPYSGNNNNNNYVNHIHPQFIHAKSEAIPISKHVEITKTIPIPIFKQIHIPYPRPVKVQIPNPILVPVSQPYPIQIPISKPYAVPMVQEIKIPIEKIIPYPIEKKVPYTIEKHVPYPIEKHIAVAIPHPVPFKFPVVRTVLHKVKSHGWN